MNNKCDRSDNLLELGTNCVAMIQKETTKKKVENVSKELLFIILTENHVIAFACLFSFKNSLILGMYHTIYSL